ncbi:MAG: sterol desaturase family protein, partial [Thioalkalivibrio sp.]|nr:sterol desaturase family protein [Thioalkalivibrio sp.]
MTWILEQEIIVRLGFLFGVVAIMAAWEILAPRRILTIGKAYRWTNNWGIVITNTVLTRLIFPAGAVGLAFFVESQGWGLLQVLDLPFWLTVLIALVVLDFAIWAQHVMFHAVPALWR